MGGAQNPLSMNRFLYAHANPATLIDPSGHVALDGESAAPPLPIDPCAGTHWGTTTCDGGGSPPGPSPGDDDADLVAPEDDDYIVELPTDDNKALTFDEIDQLSFGQLQAYLRLQFGYDGCAGAFANWPGCQDIGYAYCLLGANASGGSPGHCREYATPPDWRTDASIDLALAVAAVALSLGIATLAKSLTQVPPLVVQNAQRGREFANAALGWLKVPENWQRVPGMS